ncbi:MAG: AAA family ATPase [Bacillaceae bacterium]|nr:AAA family ATPase [Bacillaceae bacterium]
MRIEKAHIFGFGKWDDEIIDFPAPFQVIQGPNESGKTSLKQFILYILFGLPPSMKKVYTPKHGKPLGGRLFIRTEEGEQVIVERTNDAGEAECVLEGGRVEGEEYLHSLLKGMDRHTFEGIFAFGDRDLAKIRDLKGEDLGKVLFGVGMTGSDRISRMEKTFEKKAGDWFKKRGKNPVINEQIQKLKTLQNKIDELEQKEKDYSTLVEKINDIEQAIKGKKQDKEELERKQLQWNKYLQAKEAIQHYHMLKKDVLEYQDVDSFPHNGLERLEDLKHQSLPLISDMNALTKNKEEISEQINQIKQEMLSNEMYDRIKNMEHIAQNYERLKSEIEQKRIEWEEGRKSLGREIELTGLHLTIEDIQDLELSVFTEDKWKEIHQGYQELHYEQEQIEQEESHLVKEQKETEEYLSKLNEKMLAPGEQKEIENRIEQHKSEMLKQQIYQEQQQKNKRQKDYVHQLLFKLKKAQHTFLGASFILLLLSFSVSYFTQSVTGYIFGASVFLMGLLFWLVFGLIAKPLNKSFTSKESYESFARFLPELELEHLKEKLRAHQRLEKEQDHFKKKLEKLTGSIHQLEGRKQYLEAKIKRLHQMIDEELTRYPFLKGLEVNYWPSVYHQLIQLQRQAQNLARKKAEMDQLSRKLKQQEAAVQPVAEKAGIADSLDEGIKQLVNLYKQEFKIRERMEYEQERLKDIEKKMSRLQEKLDPYQKEIQTLLEMAGVKEEKDYLAMGQRYEKKQDLEEKLDYWHRQIQIIFSDQAEVVLQEAIDWDELELKMKKMDEKQKTIHQEIDTLTQQLADLRAQKKQLEESETLSDRRHQLSLLKNELKEQARHWAVLKTAESLIKETKKVYQEEYMPAVMEQASNYFHKLTGGQYQKVMLADASDTLEVANKNQMRFQPAELSEGTASQLYVSLRLALSDVMNADYGLPFIIDDAFVHFDRSREQEMHDILQDLAQKQQILYFTCHDERLSSFNNEQLLRLEKHTFSL